MNFTYEIRIAYGVISVMRFDGYGNSNEIANGLDLTQVLQQASANGMPAVSIPLQPAPY